MWYPGRNLVRRRQRKKDTEFAGALGRVAFALRGLKEEEDAKDEARAKWLLGIDDETRDNFRDEWAKAKLQGATDFRRERLCKCPLPPKPTPREPEHRRKRRLRAKIDHRGGWR